MPKVSVLLTSYNHEKYIGESIQSILDQTYKDFELVILDDASTDNSVKVIKSFKDKRIKPIFRKVNAGRAICKDIIEPLKGKNIAIAHSDDKWEKDKLEKQVKYLETHKNAAACFTWVKLIDEQGNEIKDKTIYTDFNVKNRTRYEWLNHFFYHGNCFCHPSVLLRKDVQVKDDLYTYGLGALPDMYRWTKLLLKYDIHVVEDELTCFRIRNSGGNTSGINPANLIKNSFDVYKLLDLYKSIDKKEDFLKVFPEAKQYVVKKDIVIKYALAKMCLENHGPCKNSYKFYGLNLLYELIQDENMVKKLTEMYGYDYKSFSEDLVGNDAFGMIKKDHFMDTSIYIGTDNGFSENNKLTKKVSVVGHEGFFDAKFKITKGTHKIRIDLDEDVYRSYKDLVIKINGKEVKYKGNKTKKTKERLVFLTADPQIIINSSDSIKKVELIGKTKLISNCEMEYIFSNKGIRRILRVTKRIIKKIIKR